MGVCQAATAEGAPGLFARWSALLIPRRSTTWANGGQSFAAFCAQLGVSTSASFLVATALLLLGMPAGDRGAGRRSGCRSGVLRKARPADPGRTLLRVPSRREAEGKPPARLGRGLARRRRLGPGDRGRQAGREPVDSRRAARRRRRRRCRPPPSCRPKRSSPGAMGGARRAARAGQTAQRRRCAVTAKREIDLAAGRQFWAYQPPKLHPVPPAVSDLESDHPIDRFVAGAAARRRPAQAAGRGSRGRWSAGSISTCGACRPRREEIRRLRSRHGRRLVRAAGRSAAGFAPVRRALGPALAGRRPLRRVADAARLRSARTPGAIATTSSRRSTPIGRSTASCASRSPATCCREIRWTSAAGSWSPRRSWRWATRTSKSRTRRSSTWTWSTSSST